MAVAGLASVLLVAMCVAVAVGVTKKNGGKALTPRLQAMAVLALPPRRCRLFAPRQTTKKLARRASPKPTPQTLNSLLRWHSMQQSKISGCHQNSSLFQKAADDERTKGALEVCDETLDTSIEDLKDHSTKSAISTLVSNGLAMVTDFSTILSSLNLGSFSSRRLLADDGIPSFVDARARKLMAATPTSLKPNAVVAQDGSGQYKTIGAALATLPKKTNQTFVIYVKAGVYKETVIIPRHVNNVVLIGDGPLKTRISGNKITPMALKPSTPPSSASSLRTSGLRTPPEPTSTKLSPSSLRRQSRVLQRTHGRFQDTLYAHAYRHFYRNCLISGTIDFIFGDAVAVSRTLGSSCASRWTTRLAWSPLKVARTSAASESPLFRTVTSWLSRRS
ncbi:hypothetical protein DH2020_004463 [Rehmannia glutinosa]|uniref:Pectinesterase n=1 Tax=Rehmannia glutinosa TaxID=99300 RepID=A0ABR0XPK6_REHGL